MSDPWSRPRDDHAAASAPPIAGGIEIELDGPGEPPPVDGIAVTGGTPERPEPNWRKVVGLSSLGGVLLGGVVAAVLFAGGDDGTDTPSSTTLDPVDAASLITTPPTLPPVDPPVPATTAPQTTAPATTAPAPDIDTLPSPPERTPPTYPDIVDVEIGDGEYAFDLSYLLTTPTIETAITFDDGVSGESAGVTYDPVTDRYRFTDGTGAVVFIVDIGTDTTFTSSSEEPGAWQTVDNEAFFPISELGFETYLDALLLGPIRPETVDGPISVNTSAPLVQLDDGTISRPYLVTVPAAELPEWPFLYGAFDDPAGLELQYRVYVTREGVVRRTEGVVDIADGQVLTRFDFTVGGDVSIDLPTVSE